MLDCSGLKTLTAVPLSNTGGSGGWEDCRTSKRVKVRGALAVSSPRWRRFLARSGCLVFADLGTGPTMVIHRWRLAAGCSREGSDRLLLELRTDVRREALNAVGGYSVECGDTIGLLRWVKNAVDVA